MLLVDMSNLLYRNHSKLYDLINTKGVHTGGIHGCLVSLGAVVRKYQMTKSVIACWDKRTSIGASTFRNGLYPNYKGGNSGGSMHITEDMKPEDRENHENFLWSRRMLHSTILPLTGTMSIQIEAIEADDIIAFISKNIKDTSKHVIVSSDKDLLQLVDDNTMWVDPLHNKFFDKETLIKEYELIPSIYRQHLLLTMAIVGGKNGVPNIPGVGWSWAHKISTCLLQSGVQQESDEYRTFVSKYKAFRSYDENKEQVEKNKPLVDLLALPESEVSKIRNSLKLAAQLDTSEFSEDLLIQKLKDLELNVVQGIVPYLIETNNSSNYKSILMEQL